MSQWKMFDSIRQDFDSTSKHFGNDWQYFDNLDKSRHDFRVLH